MVEAKLKVVNQPPKLSESKKPSRQETEESKRKDGSFEDVLLGLQAGNQANPAHPVLTPVEGEMPGLGEPAEPTQFEAQLGLNPQTVSPENTETDQGRKLPPGMEATDPEPLSPVLRHLLQEMNPLEDESSLGSEENSEPVEDLSPMIDPHAKNEGTKGTEKNGDAVLGSILSLSHDFTDLKAEEAKPAQVEPTPSLPKEVMQGIDALVFRGGGKMTVSLQPEHLGQMEIEVKTEGKKVSIEMLSDSHQAKALVEEHVQALRSSLADLSLNLEKFQVAVAKDGDWTQFQRFSNQDFQGRSPASARRAFESQSRVGGWEGTPEMSLRLSSMGEGRVNLRV